MRKLFLIALLALFSTNISHAQRFTDELDRGVVAVNLNGQVFVSWRILPEEYYGTTYNLYKNGSLVQSGLTVSNWTGSGTASDQFTVEPVVNGETGEMSSPAKVWNRFGSNLAGVLTFTMMPFLPTLMAMDSWSSSSSVSISGMQDKIILQVMKQSMMCGRLMM